jgi:uncharacterized alkaline shock family protein YloU
MDVVMVFGYNLMDALKRAQRSIGKELDRFAGIHLNKLAINVKTLVISKSHQNS